VAIANALQLEAARAMPSLTSLNLYPLPYYSVSAADTLPYAVTLISDLEHLQCIVCDVMKLCTKFERNRTIRGGVTAISLFDLMTLNIFKCCARLWDNFH